MAEFIGGTEMYVAVVLAGSTIELTSKYNVANFKQSVQEVNVGAGKELWSRALPGEASWTASFEGWMDAASGALGTQDLQKMVNRAMGLFVLGPQGSVTGKMKLGGSVLFRTVDADFPRAEPAKISLEMYGIGQPYWNFGSSF